MADRDVQITPGMQRYIDRNNDYLARRAEYIRDVVKKWKFDTIAVHGLYSVEDAIEDYQGAIIEPIFMSTSQAYRDSDEMAAALAYLIPTWCYSRIANPSTYYYEWTLALLEGYGFDGETSCCSTSSGMAAIMTAVQPFLVHTRHHVHEPRNFVATAQCYGGTFQQFNVRLAAGARHRVPLGRRPDQPRRVGLEDRREHALPLRRAAAATRGQGFFDIQAVADLAHSHNLPLIVRQHGRHAGAAAADLPRRRHRRAVGDQDPDLAAASASAARSSPARTSSPNIANDALKDDFAALHQVPAEPRLRPEPAPDAGDHGAERHAHAALEDGPDEPQHDEGRRVSRATTRRSRASSTSACRTTRCTSWPAGTCGWWTPSTTSCTASRSTATAT